MQESRGPLERARLQSPLQANGVRFRACASLCQLLEDASCLSALISPWDGHLGPKHVPETSPALPLLLLSVVEPSADFFEGPVSSPQLYSNCLQQKGIGEVLGNSFNMATPALGTTCVSGELACRPGWGSVPYSRQERAVLWGAGVCSAVVPAETAPDSVLPAGLGTIKRLPLPVWGPDREEGGKAGLSAMYCGLWCLDGIEQANGILVIWGAVGAT